MTKQSRQSAVGDMLAQGHHTGMPGLYCGPQFDTAVLVDFFMNLQTKFLSCPSKLSVKVRSPLLATKQFELCNGHRVTVTLGITAGHQEISSSCFHIIPHGRLHLAAAQQQSSRIWHSTPKEPSLSPSECEDDALNL
jgi:hypothetical protein